MPTPLDACVPIYFIEVDALDVLLSIRRREFVLTPAVLAEFRRTATRSRILQAVQEGRVRVEHLTFDEEHVAETLRRPGAGPKLGAGEASVVAMIRRRRLVGVTEDEGAVTHIRRDPGDGYWTGVRELLVEAVKHGNLSREDAERLRLDLRNRAGCPRLDDPLFPDG
jgi:hypothetical protein